ncbi:MAG: thiamine phosphate synthase [Planctomycetota bacterium]
MTSTTSSKSMSESRELPPSVVALTPGVLERSRAGHSEAAISAMERAALAAVRGGVRGIVVREPSLEDGAVLELARRLRSILDDAEDAGWLCVHDRVHLAEAAGANAAHVGGRSLPSAEARVVLGEARALGASSHASDAPEAVAEVFPGADYLFHAPVFAPNSKATDASEGGEAATLGWAAAEAFALEAALPVYALGGVTVERLNELKVRRAPENDSIRGLRGVALIGGIWGTTSDPAAALRALGDLRGIESRARLLAATAAARFSGDER